MKTLHLFDRYLNHTMNWAYHLMDNAPDVKHHISSFIYFNNPYLSNKFNFHYSPIQKLIGRAKDEWNIPVVHQSYNLALKKYHINSVSEYISKQSIDVVHAHFANVGAIYLNSLKKIKTPLIISFYGYDYKKIPLQNPKLGRKYPALFKRSSKILVEGEHGREALIKLGCSADKITVLHLGVLPNSESIFKRKGQPLRLFQPATFVEKKGHIHTIHAFKKALQINPNVHLTLMGEPVNKSLYNQCLSDASELVLQNKIIFKNFVPFSEFENELNKYDVLIQPSCHALDGDCEGGAPISILHAHKLGIPVISTLHCDIPEEVIHEKTGLLSKEKDVKSICQHILDFAAMSSEEFNLYSIQAQNHIRENYDIRKSGQQLQEIYKELIQEI